MEQLGETPPIFGQVKEAFGVSYIQIGLALTAFNVASALLQTPAGAVTLQLQVAGWHNVKLQFEGSKLTMLVDGKAVVTAEDSGGPVEQVRDGVSGFVTAPDPLRLAEKFDLLAEDRGLAERLGQAGRLSIAGLPWPATVRRLLLQAP